MRKPPGPAEEDEPVVLTPHSLAITHNGAPTSENTRLPLGFVAPAIQSSARKSALARLVAFEGGKGITILLTLLKHPVSLPRASQVTGSVRSSTEHVGAVLSSVTLLTGD